DLQVIAALLAGLEPLQLTPLPRVRPTRVPVGARLHGERVRALAHHPPHGVVGQLGDAEDLGHAQPQPPVDQSDRDGSLRLAGEPCCRRPTPPSVAPATGASIGAYPSPGTP